MIDPHFPLIDLHRHLDGNIRLSTIIDLALEHGIELPSYEIETLRPHVQIMGERADDLMDFIGRFRYLTGVLVDADACRRAAWENIEDAASEGIDYLELRFSPWFMAEAHGLDPAEVVAAIVDGTRAGIRDFGVQAKLIGILSRTYGPKICNQELTSLLTHKDDLVALDLAGDEANYPAGLFSEHFKKARDAGWAVTVHAGEAAGAQSIWDSIQKLGAVRIGHGLHAHEDPELMDYLVERRIGLEVSLTSNVHISAVADYSSHPLKGFLEHGIVANLNTDDPAISGIDLRHEYEVAAPLAGLGPEQIRQSQENALEMAFLSDNEKSLLKRAREAS
jgi:adenosine deaminase